MHNLSDTICYGNNHGQKGWRERETRGSKTSSNIRQPPNRGFMDDLIITTNTSVQARWVLKALE